MITDPITGNVVEYVPLNLGEGEESAPFTLRVAPEAEDAFLQAPADSRVTIMARIAPGAFQDLSTDPLDLSGYYGSHADVDFKIVAAAPLPGVTRVLISAYIPIRSAAAWL
jgi:hypothetical protein